MCVKYCIVFIIVIMVNIEQVLINFFNGWFFSLVFQHTISDFIIEIYSYFYF